MQARAVPLVSNLTTSGSSLNLSSSLGGSGANAASNNDELKRGSSKYTLDDPVSISQLLLDSINGLLSND